MTFHVLRMFFDGAGTTFHSFRMMLSWLRDELCTVSGWHFQGLGMICRWCWPYCTWSRRIRTWSRKIRDGFGMIVERSPWFRSNYFMMLAWPSDGLGMISRDAGMTLHRSGRIFFMFLGWLRMVWGSLSNEFGVIFRVLGVIFHSSVMYFHTFVMTFRVLRMFFRWCRDDFP